jgi:hypothetical protein
MKSLRNIIFFLLITLSQVVNGQHAKNPWEKWDYLIGEWVGEGNGQPGQGEGKFSFQTDLDGKIMIRKSHTVFPATANSDEIKHNDLLIIYQVGTDGEKEAIYFDNEGHTIKYKVNLTEKSIIFTGNITANAPRMRFSYTEINSKAVSITVELASPQTPDDFRPYLSGKAFKVK